MRPRWQEWVIVLAIIGIGVTGIFALWGTELRRLYHGDSDEDKAAAAEAAVLPATGGPAQGPF